jgi:hypothetical protein
MDKFPDEIMFSFMEFLPLLTLVEFSTTCSRIRALSKELLERSHFLALRKEFVLTRLSSERIWTHKWRNITSLADDYAKQFGPFSRTGFIIDTFISEFSKKPTQHFILDDYGPKSLVWNLSFGLPDISGSHSPSSSPPRTPPRDNK